VGHFVKSRTAPDDRERLADFSAIAERFDVEPSACATRLIEAGMARAARYVMSALAAVEPHSRIARGVLAALPPDPVGAALVRCARLIALLPDAHPLLQALPGFMLERSLRAGGLALGRRALERVRSRVVASV